MTITDQIIKKLADPANHGPILRTLIDSLEEDGEKGIRDRIKRWIQEINEEDPPIAESEA
jgi:hypothetical protein